MKPGEAKGLAGERRLFLKRVAILIVLLLGMAAYDLRGLVTLFWLPNQTSNAKPVETTSLEYQQIMEEAKAGVVGPAMRRALAEAAARGDLNRPIHGEKSLCDFLAEAEALAEKARALANDGGLDAAYIKPGDFDPKSVVPLMIENLQHPESGVRMEAAMTLADKRFSPHAEHALPYLKSLFEDPDPDIRWFAHLAEKRIRYFSTHRKIHAAFTTGDCERPAQSKSQNGNR